jgi:SAM-dependent methyltransferase
MIVKERSDPIDFGDLRRVTPISTIFGYDRGRPIDRYYIERFLAAHARDIKGHVLEFGDDSYARTLGGERVKRTDVLHAKAGNPKATIVADLASADHIPSNTFDCIICTQVLMFVYRIDKAVRTLHRILKPGGVLLVTVAGISQIARGDMQQWGEYWRFTTMGAERLFADVFPRGDLSVVGYGNVLVASALLQGLAAEELTAEELDYNAPDYQVSITIRAVKNGRALSNQIR